MATHHEIFDRVLKLFIKHAATSISGINPEEQVKQEVKNCLKEDYSTSQEIGLSKRAELIVAENAAKEFLKCLKNLEQSVNTPRKDALDCALVPEMQVLSDESQDSQGGLMSTHNSESKDTVVEPAFDSALESTEESASMDTDDHSQANVAGNNSTSSDPGSSQSGEDKISPYIYMGENSTSTEPVINKERAGADKPESKIETTLVKESRTFRPHDLSSPIESKPVVDSAEAKDLQEKAATVKPNDSHSSPTDTQGMWQNKRSDPSKPYHKQDEYSDCIGIQNGMRLIAASVRGRSHAHTGLHRDDDVWLHHPDSSGWSILAVADGAGSCEYSRKGSLIAVETCVRKLRETLDSSAGQALLENYPRNESEKTEEKLKALQNALHETLVTAAYAACEAINKEALDGKNAVKLYSTTLLFAAHKQTDEGHFIISFWVGDGAVALYQKDGELELLGQPDGGEYAGQTRFLDDRIFRDPSVVRRARIRLVDDFTALILATDGITDPLFESDSQLSQKQHWDNLWEKLEPIVTAEDGQIAEKGLMKWADFFSPGNHDDRTIALLTYGKAGSHD